MIGTTPRKAVAGGARLASRPSNESFFSPGENFTPQVVFEVNCPGDVQIHDGYITEPSSGSITKTKTVPRKSSMFKKLAGLFRSDNTPVPSPTTSFGSSQTSQSSVLQTPLDGEFGITHSSGFEAGRQTPRRHRPYEEEGSLESRERLSYEAVYPSRSSSKPRFHPHSPTALASSPHLPSTNFDTSVSPEGSIKRPVLPRSHSTQSIEPSCSATVSRNSRESTKPSRLPIRRSQSSMNLAVRRSKEEKRQMHLAMPLPAFPPTSSSSSSTPMQTPCSPISPLSPISWTSAHSGGSKTPTPTPSLASPRYPPELIAELSAGLDSPTIPSFPSSTVAFTQPPGSTLPNPPLSTVLSPPSSPRTQAHPPGSPSSLVMLSKKRPPISESPKVPLPPLPPTPSPLKSTFGALSADAQIEAPSPGSLTFPMSPREPRSRSPGVPSSPRVLYCAWPKISSKDGRNSGRSTPQTRDVFDDSFVTPKPTRPIPSPSPDPRISATPTSVAVASKTGEARLGSSGKTRHRPLPLTIQPEVKKHKVLISSDGTKDLQDTPSDPPSPLLPTIPPVRDRAQHDSSTESDSDSSLAHSNQGWYPLSDADAFPDSSPESQPCSIPLSSSLPELRLTVDVPMSVDSLEDPSAHSEFVPSPTTPTFSTESSPDRPSLPSAMASSPTLPLTPLNGTPGKTTPTERNVTPLRNPFENLRWRKGIPNPLADLSDEEDDYVSRRSGSPPTSASTITARSASSASSLPPLRDPFKDLRWRSSTLDDVEYDPFLLLEKLALKIPTTTKRKPVPMSSSVSASSSSSSLTPRPRPPVSKARSHPLLGGDSREEPPSLSASVSPGPSTPVTPLTPTTPPPSAYRVRSNTNASIPSTKTPTNATYTSEIHAMESSPVIVKSPSTESSLGSCHLAYLRP